MERQPNDTTRPEKMESPEQGRVAGSDQPAANQNEADISQVDQQEGQMQNGELGGNLKEAPAVPGQQKKP